MPNLQSYKLSAIARGDKELVEIIEMAERAKEWELVANDRWRDWYEADKLNQRYEERVGKLERENKDIKAAYQDREDDIESMWEMLGLTWEHFQDETGETIEKLQGDEINRLQEQNQRYKKALEETKGHLLGYDLTEAIITVNEALEESE